MRKLLLAGLAVGAGLALAAAGTTAYAQAPLKMGAGGPMTGPNAAFGAQIKTGVEQAVADINAAGGINGQKIELSIGDDASKPEQGKSAANKFISDGV
ncbi:MAG: branched chain amino acid ABC transporter substrate-binding protein, partial [Xanthobacter sp. 17-67-6]